jgi:alpha-tubulin suppressor-like RCC1 family protein
MAPSHVPTFAPETGIWIDPFLPPGASVVFPDAHEIDSGKNLSSHSAATPSPQVWIAPASPNIGDTLTCYFSRVGFSNGSFSWKKNSLTISGLSSASISASSHSVQLGDTVGCSVQFSDGVTITSAPVSLAIHLGPEISCPSKNFVGVPGGALPNQALCEVLKGSRPEMPTWSLVGPQTTCPSVAINQTTGILSGVYVSTTCQVVVRVAQGNLFSPNVQLTFEPALLVTVASSPVLSSQCAVEHEIEVAAGTGITYELSQALTSRDLNNSSAGGVALSLGAQNQRKMVQPVLSLNSLAQLDPPPSSIWLDISTMAQGSPLGQATRAESMSLSINPTTNSALTEGNLQPSSGVLGSLVPSGTDFPRASCQHCSSGASPVLSGSGLFVSNTDKGGSLCGVEASGVLYCTGYNSWGQVGRVFNTNDYWSFNNFGGPTLRPGQNIPSPNVNATPAPVPTISERIVSLTSGARHHCALVTAALPTATYDLDIPSPNPWLKKAVRCWGSHEYGQRGTGESVQSGVDTTAALRNIKPALVRTTGNSFLENAEQLASSLHSTCARLESGAVWCWGRNDSGTGLISRGADGQHSVSARETLPASYKVIHLAMGGYHACALSANYKVWCWGKNSSGQRGNASTLDSSPVSTLTEVNLSLPNGVVPMQLFAGLNFTCASRSDGKFSCWGGNQYGQLNTDPTKTSAFSNVLSPIDIEIVNTSAQSGWYFDGKSVSQLVTGHSEHLCAAMTDRSLYCWGQNNKNQARPNNSASNGVSGNQSLNTVPSRINFNSFESTCAYALASGASQLYCFGENAAGNLGRGNFTNVTNAAASQSLRPWATWKGASGASGAWPFLSQCREVLSP